MADLQSRTPISPETSFDIGSVSTQFTATAVLLLANQGKLSTSDPLSKHLEGLPSWSRTVTLGQLMHHVSGIPDYLGLLAARGIAFEEKTSREHVLKLISEVEFLNFKPGSRWEYSNSNYLLLAMVIEKISGQRLPEFLQQKIFGPLQLHMVVGPTSSLPGKARSYRVSTAGRAIRSPTGTCTQSEPEGSSRRRAPWCAGPTTTARGGWAAPGCSRPN